jgi:hypothetical protein
MPKPSNMLMELTPPLQLLQDEEEEINDLRTRH